MRGLASFWSTTRGCHVTQAALDLRPDGEVVLEVPQRGIVRPGIKRTADGSLRGFHRVPHYFALSRQ